MTAPAGAGKTSSRQVSMLTNTRWSGRCRAYARPVMDQPEGRLDPLLDEGHVDDRRRRHDHRHRASAKVARVGQHRLQGGLPEDERGGVLLPGAGEPAKGAGVQHDSRRPVRSDRVGLHFGGVTTLVVSLITALASAVLAGAGTYFTTRRDLQLKFDASLRDLRIGAYNELWKELEDLAKYGRPDPLSKSEAQRLRDTLRTWYFHTGGLVLSTDTRQDYFTLLDGLELVISGTAGEVRDEDDEFLRVLGSRLRTAMTRDVGTRRTFVFRGDAERDERWPATQTYVADSGQELVITARRRLRVVRGFKLRRRLISDEPEPRLPGGAKLVRWDPARKALTLRVARGSPDDGNLEERIFLVEDEYVVEGPRGWRRGDDARRSPSTIWRKRDAHLPRTNRHGTRAALQPGNPRPP